MTEIIIAKIISTIKKQNPMTNSTKKILVLAGDGIGPEVTKEAIKILNYFASKGLKIELDYADLGGIAIDNHNNPFPEITKEKARAADAVLLGAVGGPKWEHLDISMRPEKGLLGIRKELELFANLRPAVVFEELAEASTIKKEVISGLDLMIVRELTGGIYFGEPRGIETLPNGEQKGYNTATYTTSEIKRVGRVAFELARKRGNKVCSVDKANVLVVTELWRNVMIELQKTEFPDVELTHMYVDNAAMQLIRNPKQFDVMVTSNLFGDVLSDEASMLTGSLGMLPSASLGAANTGKCSALYEPIHGSAPDIAGKNIANPIATILSVAMMFKYSFDMPKEAGIIEQAIKNVLAANLRTGDIMQSGAKQVSTTEMGDAILEQIKK
jgi:3-isopropylmalate dehydrogenase